MADTMVSKTDISDIRRSVQRIESKQEELRTQVDQVSTTVNSVSRNLTALSAQFDAMIKEQRKTVALQQAITELVRVRQEIESRFDNYKVVRETMLGVLQATDAALVKKTTISRVSEELMLSTPKYWLAPCLVAISAWISNDRDLAERAIAEAVKRDEERTAITMALICRRNNRIDTCYEWLSIYFANQDAANFSEGTFTYIDAYVNGVFGPDDKHMCDDYINRWINEIKGRSSNFEEEQANFWKNYCSKFSVDIGGQYPALKACVPEYNCISDYVGRIGSVDAIADRFNKISNAYVDQEQLKKTIDDNLINLISRYDREEEPLRKEEAYYSAVKYYNGDVDQAKKFIKDAEQLRKERTLNLVEQMSEVVGSEIDMMPSKKKTALSFIRNYIKKGYKSYITEKKGNFPSSITINVNGWSGKTTDGSNCVQLYNDYDNYLNTRHQNELAAVDTDVPKKRMMVAGIIGVLGFIMCFLALPLGIIMLIAAGICGFKTIGAKKDIENSINELNSRYENMHAQGKDTIRVCVDQWNQARNVASQFNDAPEREIVA